MEKIIFLILFAFYLIFQSCTSTVQTRYNFKIPKLNQEKLTLKDSNQTKLVVDHTPPEEITLEPSLNDLEIVYDTVKIDLREIVNYPVEISRGNELFSNGDYRGALQSFLSYINRSNEIDFYYWLARFKIAECLYNLNHTEQSIEELVELLQNKNIPSSIKERIYFQLANIYCERNSLSESNFYIELLEIEFPNSQLLDSYKCK